MIFVLRKSCLLMLFVLFVQIAFANERMLNGIVYRVQEDGAVVVKCKRQNKKVSIPPSIIVGNKTYVVKYIGSHAFENCERVVKISLPSTIVEIRGFAFENCKKLSEIVIPERVKSIESYAFLGCRSLTNINIPESTTFIGEGVFNSCDSLMKIKVNERNIVYDSREECNAIIKTKDNILLAGCAGTVIPNGIVKLDNWAFAGTGISKIFIPPTVDSLGSGVFDNCEKIEYIVCYSEDPPAESPLGSHQFVGTKEFVLYVPEGSVERYANSIEWRCVRQKHEEKCLNRINTIYVWFTEISIEVKPIIVPKIQASGKIRSKCR